MHGDRSCGALAAALVLSIGCGGGGGGKTEVEVGATVSGLEGTGLVLRLNGVEEHAVDADGSFTFATRIEKGKSYEVTVGSQPAPRIPTGLVACAVKDGSGTAGKQDVNVAIACKTTALFVGNGWDLWRTDGTAAGTGLVKAFPGPGYTYPLELTSFRGAVYFWAYDLGSTDFVLWKTDGTEVGTAPMKITGGEVVQDPRNFTVLDGVLYFSAWDPGHGSELWRTDGTEAGTERVADIMPGPEGSSPLGLTAFGGALFFSACSQLTDHGSWKSPGDCELWKTDGTEAGTKRVADINPGADSSNPRGFTVFGGALYFDACSQVVDNGAGLKYPADCELWRTDGTGVGTKRVADINPGTGNANPQELTVLGGALYFNADQGGSSRLWRTDGTEAGTVEVPAAHGETLTDPWSLTLCGSALYFSALDPTHGLELWKVDGAVASRVTDLNAGTGHSYPRELTAFGSTLYFQAADYADEANDLYDLEPWTTDGTAAGTTRLKDIYPGKRGSFPWDFTPVNGSLLFGTQDQDVNGLWSTDGTTDGTKQIGSVKFCGFTYGSGC